MVVGLDYAGGVLVGGGIWGEGGVDSLEWRGGRGGWVYGRHCRGGGVYLEKKDAKKMMPELFVGDDAECGW
mgnify:CR=1 FL=1